MDATAVTQRASRWRCSPLRAQERWSGWFGLAAFCVSACGSGGASTARDARDGSVMPDATMIPDAAMIADATMIPDATMNDGPGHLRVVSWNIKAARRAPLDAIGRRLLELQPDVVALQEVDQNVDRTGGVDQAALLAEMLAADHVFAAAIPYQNGLYGLATLSRYPFGEVGPIALSNEGADELRTALDTELCVGAMCVRLVNHHADLVAPAAERSALEILDAVRGDIGSGVIVAGDFNQRPGDLGPRSYVEAGFDDLVAATESASETSDRVDFIFVDDTLSRCSVRAEIVDLDESDHDALLADFDLSRCRR